MISTLNFVIVQYFTGGLPSSILLILHTLSEDPKNYIPLFLPFGSAFPLLPPSFMRLAWQSNSEMLSEILRLSELKV